MALNVTFTGAPDGDDGPYQLATANGWSLACRWVLGRTGVPRLPALESLVRDGEARGTAALAADLRVAAAECCHPAVLHTLRQLSEKLGAGHRLEIAVVTD